MPPACGSCSVAIPLVGRGSSILGCCVSVESKHSANSYEALPAEGLLRPAEGCGLAAVSGCGSSTGCAGGFGGDLQGLSGAPMGACKHSCSHSADERTRINHTDVRLIGPVRPVRGFNKVHMACRRDWRRWACWHSAKSYDWGSQPPNLIDIMLGGLYHRNAAWCFSHCSAVCLFRDHMVLTSAFKHEALLANSCIKRIALTSQWHIMYYTCPSLCQYFLRLQSCPLYTRLG